MRVGAIPFYRGEDGLRVCMVSTSAHRKSFTFPKGVLKRRETWQHGALRELREEAGIEGRVLLPRHPLVLSGLKRPADSIVLYWCEIESVHDKWKEDGMRKRKFFPVDRLPKARLGRTGRKVFREILELDLSPEMGVDDDGGRGAAEAPVRAGILGSIRSSLAKLALRPDLDAAGRD